MTTRHGAALAGGFVAAMLLPLAVLPVQQREAFPAPRLTVPPGFEVERIAGPPLVERPIVADFDEDGRMYVADSSGSNDKSKNSSPIGPIASSGSRTPTATDGSTRRVVFADRMMLPEGTMWFDGSLYVAAPPSIWKLTDTDGDGVADRREEWFKGETLTSCANDLHGPYLGPDGWIYWTKGAFAQQTYARAGQQPLVTRAAHIFRRRPGDSAIDVVITGGMDNPVDVAFTPAGERIFTSTFLEHPQAGRRDALVHAIYGGVYGKPHAVIDGHPRTGPTSCRSCVSSVPQCRPASRGTHRVSSAPSFATTSLPRCSTCERSRGTSSCPRARRSRRGTRDFLISDDRDFHPTDVIEDADGSLARDRYGPLVQTLLSRRRSWRSPRFTARSIASGGRAHRGRPIPAAGRLPGAR